MDEDRPDPSSTAFAPRRVAPGTRRRPAELVVVLGVTLVVLGLLTRITSPVDELLAFAPSPSPTVVVPTIPPPPRRLPASLICHSLARSDCVAIIRTAMASLAEDVRDPVAASAWSSLLCDSTLDCSALDLRTSIPRGSVILSFGDDGPDAWLNVVDHPPAAGRDRTSEAWIVRWARFVFPSPSPSVAPSP